MIKCKKDIKTSLSSLCLTSYANPWVHILINEIYFIYEILTDFV
jgi:hypothetical protein